MVDGAIRGVLRWRGSGGGSGSGGSGALDAADDDVTARFTASLQWEGLLPRSTIDLEGDRWVLLEGRTRIRRPACRGRIWMGELTCAFVRAVVP